MRRKLESSTVGIDSDQMTSTTPSMCDEYLELSLSTDLVSFKLSLLQAKAAESAKTSLRFEIHFPILKKTFYLVKHILHKFPEPESSIHCLEFNKHNFGLNY